MAPSLSAVCLRAGLVAAALTCLTSTADAARRKPADPEIWVTIATDELAQLREDAVGKAADRLPVAFENYEGVTLALTRESRLGELAAAMHTRFHRCGGFVAHNTREEGLLWLYAPLAPELPGVNYSIDSAATVQALFDQVAGANIVDTIAGLSSFHTRYYTTQTGYDAAVWLKSQWESLAAGRSDVRVSFFDHPTWLQHSVIASIQGTEFPKEVVVIGGHLDSINSSAPTTGRAPGADDDASGVASITETFRAAMATGYRPARTVMFMAYAGEEAGLRGSKEIAASLNQATGLSKLKVIGAFQLDMTNTRSTAPDAVDFGVLTDAAHTDAAQTSFVRDLLATYLGAPLIQADTACNYGCSDHSAWKIQGGVPSSMVFEARFGQHNQNLHKITDDLAHSDGTGSHAAKFSKLAAAYMAELAKGAILPITLAPPVAPPVAPTIAPTR